MPIAIQPPVPTSGETQAHVGQIISVLDEVRGIVQSEQNFIRSLIALQASKGQIDCGALIGNIQAILESRISQVGEQCAGNAQCIELSIAGLTSAAWELAAQAGCSSPQAAGAAYDQMMQLEQSQIAADASYAHTLQSESNRSSAGNASDLITPTSTGTQGSSSYHPGVQSGGVILGGAGNDAMPGAISGYGLPANAPPGPPPPPPPPPIVPSCAADAACSLPESPCLDGLRAAIAAADAALGTPAYNALCQGVVALRASLYAIAQANASLAIQAANAAIASAAVVGNAAAQAAYDAASECYTRAKNAVGGINVQCHVVCGCNPFPDLPPFPAFAPTGIITPPPPPPPPPSKPGECSTDNTPIGYKASGEPSFIPSADPQVAIAMMGGINDVFPGPIGVGTGTGGGVGPTVCSTCGQSKPCGCQKACPPDKPKKNQWCIYRDGDGNCYFVSPGQEPNSPTDTLIGCASDPGQLQPIMDKCKQGGKVPQDDLPGWLVGPNGAMFCSLDIDQSIAEYFYTLPIQGATLVGLSQQIISGQLGPWDAAGQTWKVAPFWAKVPASMLALATAVPLKLMGSLLNGWLFGQGCYSLVLVPLYTYRAIVGFAERWLSSAFGDVAITATYLTNYFCPRRIPTTDQANACLLANTIDTSLWATWVACNGDCPEPQSVVVDAMRSKESVGDLVQLFMREIIDGEEYQSRISQLGYNQGYEAQDYIALAQQIPPVSELIRMMVRDVTNEQVVTDFGLAKGFEDNWNGQLKQWGQNQGISDQYALYEWMAHWSIPSPTQLYEMFHRFRNLDPGDPLYTDQSTIKTALKQADVLPFWQDRLIASAYRLVPRSDIIQMSRYGVFSDQQLQQKVTQIGYTDDDATLYIQYLHRRHALQARTHPYTRLYIRGEISEQILRNQLQSDYYQSDEIDGIVQYAKGIFAGRLAAQCRDGIRKQFFIGELDAIQVQQGLTELGYDPQQVQSYISNWTCVRSSKLKHNTAAQLCKYAKEGLITIGQMQQRLSVIGYDDFAITNITSSCGFEIQKAKQAQQLKEQQAIIKAQEKAARLAAREAQQLARAAQQAARQNAQFQKLAVAYQKQLVKAAEKWTRGCGGDVWSNMTQIVTAAEWIAANTPFTADEQLDILIESATLMDGKASCDWESVYQGVAGAWLETRSIAPGPAD